MTSGIGRTVGRQPLVQIHHVEPPRATRKPFEVARSHRPGQQVFAVTTSVEEALRVQIEQGTVVAQVPEGFDVFGVPHGGFLFALTGQAILKKAGVPDLFSLTTHFLKKAEVGPVEFSVHDTGHSRRFRSVRAEARQNGTIILSASALVGHRSGFEGPAWSCHRRWVPKQEELAPVEGFPRPGIAERFDLRLSQQTMGFVTGKLTDRAELYAMCTGAQASQLTALVACDLTPPALWNVTGMTGWTPTVELTAHVRARPAPGPMSIEVQTNFLSGGFLEEDALVFDSEGTLIVQSRQLARHAKNS